MDLNDVIKLRVWNFKLLFCSWLLAGTSSCHACPFQIRTEYVHDWLTLEWQALKDIHRGSSTQFGCGTRPSFHCTPRSAELRSCVNRWISFSQATPNRVSRGSSPKKYTGSQPFSRVKVENHCIRVFCTNKKNDIFLSNRTVTQHPNGAKTSKL